MKSVGLRIIGSCSFSPVSDMRWTQCWYSWRARHWPQWLENLTQATLKAFSLQITLVFLQELFSGVWMEIYSVANGHSIFLFSFVLSSVLLQVQRKSVSPRWVLNLTSYSPNWISLTIFVALLAFGGGGNLVLDTTVFLEYLPSNKQYVLTLLAAWWGVGQTFTGFMAWAFCKLYHPNLKNINF